jgi:hypothetical protein
MQREVRFDKQVVNSATSILVCLVNNWIQDWFIGHGAIQDGTGDRCPRHSCDFWAIVFDN